MTFEFKANSMTLNILRLKSLDLEMINRDLSRKVELTPNFFDNTAVVVDFIDVENEKLNFEMLKLLDIIRSYSLIPVGFYATSNLLQEKLRDLNLPLMKNLRIKQYNKKIIKEDIIKTGKIRAGQKIVSQNGDLIVIGSVNEGADLIAKGNIYVFGELKGRAIAGIDGDKNAKIICTNLNAQLVSIAGNYKLFSDIISQKDALAFKVFLQNNEVQVVKIKK